MPPLVTIGLPVWNAARFLPSTLRSIFAQTVTDWELLIVDDGSTDESARIAASAKHPRVKALSDGRHVGLAARLNQIAKLASGEYLARMDADDLMHPRRLELQLARLRHSPACDVVGCGMLILGANGRPAGVRRLPLEHEAIAANVVRQLRLAHATALARTSWWKQFRYDETAPLGVEDWRFWLDAAATTRFANVPELLYYYREFDSFRMTNYLRNKKGHIERLWNQPSLPRMTAALETLRQSAAAGVFILGAMFGLSNVLISRRNEPVPTAERDAFELALRQIDATKLPDGLNL